MDALVRIRKDADNLAGWWEFRGSFLSQIGAIYRGGVVGVLIGAGGASLRGGNGLGLASHRRVGNRLYGT